MAVAKSYPQPNYAAKSKAWRQCADDRRAWEADVARGKIKKPFEIPPGATPFSVDVPIAPAQPQLETPQK
jgi:hypothetical protein